MFQAIAAIFKILPHLPILLQLIQQIVKIIEELTGEASRDESAKVSEVKALAAKIKELHPKM